MVQYDHFCAAAKSLLSPTEKELLDTKHQQHRLTQRF
jgi:hypothetical protein